MLNFEPTIGHLFSFSLFDVFINYEHTKTYVGPLWTMRFELFGSFVVLAAILIVRTVSFRAWLLAALALGILMMPISSWAALALFPIGALLADLFLKGRLDAIPAPAAIISILAGCAIPLLIPYGIVAWGGSCSHVSSCRMRCGAISEELVEFSTIGSPRKVIIPTVSYTRAGALPCRRSVNEACGNRFLRGIVYRSFSYRLVLCSSLSV